jgi:hypothetical protein
VLLTSFQTLRHAHTREDVYGGILASTKAIAFFGTPHQGADPAKWATALGHIAKVVGIRATKALQDLRTWSDPLVELSADFCNLPRKHNITIYTFFETSKTNKVQVVEEGSARMSIPEERARSLAGNHIQICKFEAADANWQAVSKKFTTIVADMGLLDDLERELPAVPRGQVGASLLETSVDGDGGNTDLTQRWKTLRTSQNSAREV